MSDDMFPNSVQDTVDDKDIAVIGMSGRFPGARSVDELWQNLCGGVESISFFTDEELLEAGLPTSALESPHYVKARGALGGVELFDASFFGFSPREAEVMDPQQRLFLECAWEALENAGYTPEKYAGLIGVYAGAGTNTYAWNNLRSNPARTEAVGGFQTALSNEKDFLTTQVSYRFNLKGPGVTVQTACSTSLVGVHLACLSLANFECDMALAGGVAVKLPERSGYWYREGGILSPDGHCRAFDAAARGTVSGNGVGIVVLKRLADALEDGDSVLAVIKGSAINNDGAQKVGYTAPGVDGQAEVIAAALALSGVEPESLTYVETHGTGTEVGDPIEIAALTQVFRASTGAQQFCAVGSVKSNLGHLDTAAGVTGLIKTVLALRHGFLPPSLHYTRANERIDFESSPFFVNTRLREWRTDGLPRRAAVSSFGIGGTNAHAILEEAPALGPSGPSRPWQLLAVSARTEPALGCATTRLHEHLREHPELDLADVAYTLKVGRKSFEHRRILVCDSYQDTIEVLSGSHPKRLVSSVGQGASQPPVAFLFPGQGAQYVHMARELYETEPTFRDQIDEAVGIAAPHLGFDLREVMWPAEEQAEEASRRLTETSSAQVALFVVEYALARLLMEWGVTPSAMLGHSIGEYVAACLAGVFSLPDALRLVIARGRMMQELPGGAMMAVSLGEETLRSRDDWEGLCLAAVNAPDLCVVSGPEEKAVAWSRRLGEEGVEWRRLHTSHAFHSAAIDPIVDPFAELVGQIERKAPRIRMISNVSGTWLSDPEATDPTYWARHLRRTVEFSRGVSELLEDPDTVFLEVGPGRGLSSLVRRQDTGRARVVLASMRHPKDLEADPAFLLTALGRLWLTGVEPDWTAFYRRERRRRIPLPSYPFERQRYWVEPAGLGSSDQGPGHLRLYAPAWKNVLRPVLPSSESTEEADPPWLVRGAAQEVARVVRRLEELGRRGVHASDESSPAEFSGPWLEELDLSAGPLRVLFLWQPAPPPGALFDLLALARVLGERSRPLPAEITVVAPGALEIRGDEALDPTAADLLAAARTIPREYPNLRCRFLDMTLPEAGPDHLLAEVLAGQDEPVVAWRHARRWIPSFESLDMEGASAERELGPIREGVCLIAGALDAPARALARLWGKERVLFLPSKAVADTASTEPTGPEVVVLPASLAGGPDVRQAVSQAQERYGPVRRVLYSPGRGAPRKIAEIETGDDLRRPVVEEELALLERTLADQPIDAWLLFSSLTSLTGAAGQLAEAAVETRLDVAARKHNRDSATPWLRIQWEDAVTNGDEAVTNRDNAVTNGGDEARTARLWSVLLSSHLEPHLVVSRRPPRDPLPRSRAAEQAPSPPRDPERIETAPDAPQSDLQRQLVDIWQDLLGIEPIGIHDHFFDLGGHSLLATQLMTRLRDALQVALPLSSIFEAPTIAELAPLVEQAETGRLAQELAAELPAVVPAPEERHEPFPLTDVQEAYWVGRSGAFELGQVAPHFYQEFESADLDFERLCRAWRRLIEHHEMLRAVMLPDGRQQILERVPEYEIEVLDLREEPPEAATARLEEVRASMSHQVLSIDEWPLFELRATHLGERHYRLHLSFDILLGDAWSWQILARDFESFYQDPEASAKPPELSFRDYVLAASKLPESPVYQRSLEYWRGRLGGMPPAPQLPFAIPPESLKKTRFLRRRGRLDRETWGRLKARATRSGLTPSVLLVAVFAEVLATWSRSPRLTLNLPLFNRLPLHPGVNDVVGDFTSVNLLAIDNSLHDGFEARARRIQEQLWADLEHRYVSGVWVLRELARAWGSAGRAIMPVVFTSTLNLAGGGRNDDEEVEDGAYGISQTPQVWLDHQVRERGGALHFNWDTVEELFPAGLIAEMWRAYGRLLERLAVDEESWHEPFPPLVPEEHQRLVAGVNATQAALGGGLLHEPMAAQVARRPGQPAVLTADRTLTYAELERLSNQVGHRLRELGARPGRLVMVSLEKGWEQMVAVFGVLKSGAAYLPVDPALPQERLSHLLEHSETELVLTRRRFAEQVRGLTKARLLAVDGDDFADAEATPPPPVADPQELAYVIYTSGSTGWPKGVMIEHRAALNTVIDINRRFAVGPEDRVLALSALGFDLSVYDIFGPLSVGGAVVVPEPSAAPDPAHWLELAVLHRVTIWNSVPALMEILVDYLENGSKPLPESLRLVLLSGDWIPLSLPERIKALAGDVRVISLGGATEASIWSIFYPIDRPDPDGPSIPYGQPLSNQRFYVLDEALAPRPLYVPGQLYIAGDGLARGYWRDEATTQASFFHHPRTGERLYRTGDLGRYLPDGNIEFLGREDFQVKVQGHRIELGEIESALEQHPDVRSAVVTVRGERHEQKRLVAYVVASRGEEPALTEDLNDFLRQKLPRYMLPSAFVVLDTLPLSANGKVDRRRLPAPESTRKKSDEASGGAPASDLEHTIAAALQDVLGLSEVGVNDNFFDLGATSLLMVRVQAKLREKLRQEIAMVHLFEHPTIRSLSKHLAQKNGDLEVLHRDQDRLDARRAALRDRSKLRMEIRNRRGSFVNEQL